jgi:predicted lipid-binding transport protein (Tim44 family)
MKLRHVFMTEDAEHARRVVRMLHERGLAYTAISLVARDDIESGSIPNRLREADTDFVPAAIRGMAFGAAAGLLAGLAATAFPALGIGLAGAAGIGVIGALVGGLSSALMGATAPDPIRQRFEPEIASGRVLMLVDADEATHARLEQPLAAAGAVRMRYEAHTAMA